MRGVHPPKKEILRQYRALYKKLGRTPGISLFAHETSIRKRDVYFHWRYFDDLVREAGATPNQIPAPITDEEILREYARVCLHLGRIPGQLELHQTARRIGARIYSVYQRFGAIAEFDRVFRAWLLKAPPEFKRILAMPGWRRKGSALKAALPPPPKLAERPWLPAGLRDLEALGRQEMPEQVAKSEGAEGRFEQRCAQAFQALGFETWGYGAKPSRTCFLAIAPNHTYGVVLESEARQGDYVLPDARDSALAARVTQGLECLKEAGARKVYLACIGPTFREIDLAAVRDHLACARLAGITLFSAAALLGIVEASIRRRASFTLAEFEKTLAGDNLMA